MCVVCKGCGCENTEFGCCPDKTTPAPGPDRICPCVASQFGCCPDGESEALGEHFEGCQDIPLRPGGNSAIYVIFNYYP